MRDQVRQNITQKLFEAWLESECMHLTDMPTSDQKTARKRIISEAKEYMDGLLVTIPDQWKQELRIK